MAIDETKPLFAHQWIHLADNEWGCDLMEEIARKTFAEWESDKERLALMVYEHAGWNLTFGWIDGRMVCVDSANDSAVFGQKVKDWWREYNTSPKLYDQINPTEVVHQ